MGGPWTLTRIVGAARARDLYFLPDKFDADEALRIGPREPRVLPDDRFRDEIAPSPSGWPTRRRWPCGH